MATIQFAPTPAGAPNPFGVKGSQFGVMPPESAVMPAPPGSPTGPNTAPGTQLSATSVTPDINQPLAPGQTNPGLIAKQMQSVTQ